MKVAWDARPLLARHRRGIGQYAANLLEAISSAASPPDLVLFADGDGAGVVADPRLRVVKPSVGYRWQLWERATLPWYAARAGCDLLHSLANTTPPHASVPRIVTVHDVIPFLPDFRPSTPEIPYFTKTVPNAIRRAALVLTDSACSKQDVIEHFGVSEDRVRVVPLAAPIRRPPGDAPPLRQLRSTAGVEKPYLLALAATERRKNTHGVLRAFRELAGRHPELRLVLTGVVGDATHEVERSIMALGLRRERVVTFPFVSESDLAVLYASADCFLFLSLYEGFGIPILEALRSGAPVVCSNRASCPEVAGSAAELVDPEDPQAVADAVDRIRGDSPESRTKRREAGFSHERTFTWRRTADLTLQAYADVLGT